MTHQLEITVRFKRWNRLFYRNAKRPRQDNPFAVMFEIHNRGQSQFPGASLDSLKFSTAERVGLTHLISFHNGLGPLAPNSKMIIETEVFSTYNYGHCALEVNLLANDHEAIEIWLLGPSSLNPEKQYKDNIILTACYVESEEQISQRWSSRLSFLLSLVATGASVIALKISSESSATSSAITEYHKEMAAQVLGKIDSLNSNVVNLLPINNKLEDILLKMPQKLSTPLKGK